MTNQVAIAVGLIAGLLFGLIAHETGARPLLAIADGVAPLGTLFVNAVRMVVIPLVATTIFAGVAGLGDLRRLGRFGGMAIGFFWATTLLGIISGMTLMKIALPLSPASTVPGVSESAARELPSTVDFLVGLIPPNPFEAAANGDLLPIIVFTVLFAAAVGAISVSQREQLISLAEAIAAALIRLVHWILWTAPVGVFALAAPVTAESGWSIFLSLGVFVLTVIVGLLMFIAAVYVPVAAVVGQIAPRDFLRACLGPQLIAFATTSSVATLPAMLEAAEQRLGVSRQLAGLVLSLGASLNRAGSGLFQGAAIVFLASLYQVPVPWTALAGALLVTFLVALTVTGVPSSSVVTLTPALETLGVPLAGMAVLLGVDRIPDMVRTATNVTGHLTAAVAIDTVSRRHSPNPPSPKRPD